MYIPTFPECILTTKNPHVTLYPLKPRQLHMYEPMSPYVAVGLATTMYTPWQGLVLHGFLSGDPNSIDGRQGLPPCCGC